MYRNKFCMKESEEVEEEIENLYIKKTKKTMCYDVIYALRFTLRSADQLISLLKCTFFILFLQIFPISIIKCILFINYIISAAYFRKAYAMIYTSYINKFF